MRINADDPRITAYIMDELSAAERASFEEELLACPESRAHVEEMRQTAELLHSELSQEAAAMPEARPKQPRRFWSRRRKIVAALSATAAACLVLGLGLATMYRPRALYNTGFVASDEAARGPTFALRPPSSAELTVDGKERFSSLSLEEDGDRVEWLKKKGPDQPGDPPGSAERYARVAESPFHLVAERPLSTFSVDVDTAAYANVRRFLRQSALPPKDAVRIEELINYFDYRYAPPAGNEPFSVRVDQASCPWNPRHSLVRIGLKGRELQTDRRPPSNLVFLLDVSGSMSDDNKLPLLRRGMDMMVRRLGENDRVAIAVYAGAAGVVLPSTACTEENKPKIRAALERLQAGGSTAGGAGIQLAYDLAVRHFIQGGVNRVILATDGDFNVGLTDHDALVRLIEQKAKSSVFLTVLGLGMGNLNDKTLEQLADKGNGNYAYIDTENEARKVLVQQLSGTLVTIAKDVKIQVELNPARVAAYRLIGYDNRRLAAKDFNDDTKDAGEIGAGHTVTALYEIVPADAADALRALRLRYQRPAVGPAQGELLTVKLRYKEPEGTRSKLIERPVREQRRQLETASPDFKLAAAVAWLGMVLRDSPHLAETGDPLGRALELARQGAVSDPHGYRRELVELIQIARRLKSGR